MVMASVKEVKCHFEDNWHKASYDREQYAFARGYVWLENAYCEGRQIAEKIFEKMNEETTSDSSLIPEFGHFAFAGRKDNRFIAFVDRVRSIPLYFGNKNGVFFLSDNAHWIRDALGDYKLDGFALDEFRLSGFVTGCDTLSPNVKQLQAGEILVLDLFSSSNTFQVKRYYEWKTGELFEQDEEELFDELDNVFMNSFERLVKSIEGRRVLLPLSGGLDSRLVATMLKKFGVEDVTCFAYGKRDNFEAEISKQVAKKLGYEWIFIPYTRNIWRDFSRSHLFRQYLNYSDGLSSLPYIQDVIAINTLKQKYEFGKGCIIIPGHTGDFLTGGHITFMQPFMRSGKKHIEKQIVLNEIIKKHYRLNSLQQASEDFRAGLAKRVESRLPSEYDCSPIDAYTFFEYFTWQERQAKFILNSLRAFEFLGFDWRIPWWDSDIMHFWQKVDIQKKLWRSFFRYYLIRANHFDLYSDMELQSYNQLSASRWKTQSKIEANLKLVVAGLRKQFLSYFEDNMQWYGMYPYFHVAFGKYRFQNINSFLVDTYIENLN